MYFDPKFLKPNLPIWVDPNLVLKCKRVYFGFQFKVEHFQAVYSIIEFFH